MTGLKRGGLDRRGKDWIEEGRTGLRGDDRIEERRTGLKIGGLD